MCRHIFVSHTNESVRKKEWATNIYLLLTDDKDVIQLFNPVHFGEQLINDCIIHVIVLHRNFDFRNFECSVPFHLDSCYFPSHIRPWEFRYLPTCDDDEVNGAVNGEWFQFFIAQGRAKTWWRRSMIHYRLRFRVSKRPYRNKISEIDWRLSGSLVLLLATLRTISPLFLQMASISSNMMTCRPEFAPCLINIFQIILLQIFIRVFLRITTCPDHIQPLQRAREFVVRTLQHTEKEASCCFEEIRGLYPESPVRWRFWSMQPSEVPRSFARLAFCLFREGRRAKFRGHAQFLKLSYHQLN